MLALAANSIAKSLSLTASIELLDMALKFNLFASIALSTLNLLPARAAEPNGITLILFCESENLEKSLSSISNQDIK